MVEHYRKLMLEKGLDEAVSNVKVILLKFLDNSIYCYTFVIHLYNSHFEGCWGRRFI